MGRDHMADELQVCPSTATQFLYSTGFSSFYRPCGNTHYGRLPMDCEPWPAPAGPTDSRLAVGGCAGLRQWYRLRLVTR